MNINKITKLKNNKYKIEIDNEEIITYDDVILENNILYNKTIDRKTLKEIESKTKFYDIYNKVLNYIAKKIRSEKEIHDYLVKNEVSDSDINTIIDKLKKSNLINDRKYTIAYINDQINLNKKGIKRIKQELLDKNIDYSIIEEELGKVDSSIIDDNLNRLVLKRINSNTKYSNSELKNRILNEIIRLGYSKEKAIYIIDNNMKEDNTIIDKAYNKLYIKYSKKYSNEELLYVIKNKLYTKGFSIDEINKVLEEKTEDY